MKPTVAPAFLIRECLNLIASALVTKTINVVISVYNTVSAPQYHILVSNFRYTAEDHFDYLIIIIISKNQPLVRNVLTNINQIKF